MSIVEKILADVALRPAYNGVKVIGVDGPAGSGKSTLARELVTASAGTLIEVDDFVAWDDLAGWWPRFEAQVLGPLFRGENPRYQVRDWRNDWRGMSLNGWKTAKRTDIVVIEGVTCTRRETVGRYAYAVWTQAPAEQRLARGLARDHGQGYDVTALWRRWMVEEDAFFAADRTRDRADLVVDTEEQ
jgi:uridine kinase